MSAVTLADLLPDFGKRGAPASFGLSRPPAAAPQVAPQPDISEIVAAEIAKAEAALEERLALAHQAEIEALRQEHAAELEVTERRCGEAAGAAIAARIGEMEDRVGELASAAAARILGSVLSDDLCRRSVEALARSIAEAAADREAVRIKVHGPLFLFEALREAAGPRAQLLDFNETAGFDLTVSVDGTLFETRLSEWSAALSEALS